MSWIDWLIVLCPLALITFIGLKAQKYVKSVADFLSAGRVAGRYIVAVASGEAGMGLISLVAFFETYYNSGLAYSFWQAIGVPVSMIFLLTGFCIYRYRETRAMTMGQFFEMRYNRAFRVFAGILQSISAILNYAIFPAVGARFLVYFCDFPLTVNICGLEFQTFMIVMAVFLSIAVFVACIGGQITIMVTDCILGIISYPLYAVIVVYLLMKYSWFDDIAPALLNQPEGMSMLNPFDIDKLRDFNLFYVLVGIFSMIFNRMAWSGCQGYNSAALNAHEQKMSQVLGTWRVGFSFMMYVILAIVAFTFMNSNKFQASAEQVRDTLAVKTMNDVIRDDKFQDVRKEISDYIQTGELSKSGQEKVKKVEAEQKQYARDILARKIRYGLISKEQAAEGEAVEISADNPADEREHVMVISKKLIQSEGIDARGQAQTFGTILRQMRVPMTLKHILPVGITGIFCALCIFLLVSTDTTYLHSWSSIIIQDVVLPIRGKPFTPRYQLMLLRIVIACVALFAFLFSSFFGQVDFIAMFLAITGAIWLGGAGPCIVGGLYWKRGTSAGAFAALICGSTLAVSGIIMQQLWVDNIVPWLESNELIGSVAIILETASQPFEPYIQWRMDLEKFPINSQEIFFFAMLFSLLLYVVVSLLTCRQPFNMERILHRGKYQREGETFTIPKVTRRNWFTRLIGIDSQYTKGDKAIAWSVFIYSFGWGFGSFLIIVIWNNIQRWPRDWWSTWYFIASIVVPGIIAVVSTVWFTIGGVIDLRRLFRRLATKENSVLDDGRVIGHVSADDVEMVEKIDHISLPEAHMEEKILRDELQEEGDFEDIKNLDEHIKQQIYRQNVRNSMDSFQCSSYFTRKQAVAMYALREPVISCIYNIFRKIP